MLEAAAAATAAAFAAAAFAAAAFAAAAFAAAAFAAAAFAAAAFAAAAFAAAAFAAAAAAAAIAAGSPITFLSPPKAPASGDGVGIILGTGAPIGGGFFRLYARLGFTGSLSGFFRGRPRFLFIGGSLSASKPPKKFCEYDEYCCR
jgi:hypothetical protein